METLKAEMEDLRRQLEAAKAEAEKPFQYEEEYRRKAARLAELDAALNLGSKAAT